MATREIVKKGKNFVRYSDGTIRLDNVRLSYPNVYTPFEGKNDDGKDTAKYGVVGLMDKKTHKEAKDELVAMKEQFLKDNKVAKLAADKFFVRNGDDSDKDGYEGCFSVHTSETKQPKLRNADKSVIDPENKKHQGIIFGGCYGNILIRPWFQNSPKYGKRVNAGIVAVQFLRNGDPFGDSRISDEEVDDSFDDLGSDDEDGDGGFSGDDDDL